MATTFAFASVRFLLYGSSPPIHHFYSQLFSESAKYILKLPELTPTVLAKYILKLPELTPTLLAKYILKLPELTPTVLVRILPELYKKLWRRQL